MGGEYRSMDNYANYAETYLEKSRGAASRLLPLLAEYLNERNPQLCMT